MPGNHHPNEAEPAPVDAAAELAAVQSFPVDSYAYCCRIYMVAENFERAMQYDRAAECFMAFAEHAPAADLSDLVLNLSGKERAFFRERRGVAYTRAGNNYEKLAKNAGSPEEAEANWRAAATVFINSVEHRAEKAQPWGRAGNCYIKLKEWRTAAAAFMQAQEFREPSDHFARAMDFTQAGNCYERHEDWAWAAETFKKGAEEWKTLKRTVYFKDVAFALVRAGNNHERLAAQSGARAEGREAHCLVAARLFIEAAQYHVNAENRSRDYARAAVCFANAGQPEAAKIYFDEAMGVATDENQRRIVSASKRKYIPPAGGESDEKGNDGNFLVLETWEKIFSMPPDAGEWSGRRPRQLEPT